MAWHQLKTVQHDFSGGADNDDLADDLPSTEPTSGHASCRFLVCNEDGIGDAYFLVAADLSAAGGLDRSALKIPAGQTRYSPVYPWPMAASSHYLRGEAGADCYVTPEVNPNP